MTSSPSIGISRPNATIFPASTRSESPSAIRSGKISRPLVKIIGGSIIAFTLAAVHHPPAMIPEFDVAIVGGAFSGAATALLIKRRRPDTRILIIEKATVFDRKVGESTTEVSSCFLTKILGLTSYLGHEQLAKQGLRLWFANRPGSAVRRLRGDWRALSGAAAHLSGRSGETRRASARARGGGRVRSLEAGQSHRAAISRGRRVSR